MPVIPFLFPDEPCGSDLNKYTIPPPKKRGANCSDAVPIFEVDCTGLSSVVGLNFFPKKCTVLKSGKEENSKAWWISFWSDGKFFTLKSDEPLPAFIKDGALVDFEWQVKNGASIAKMHEVKL